MRHVIRDRRGERRKSETDVNICISTINSLVSQFASKLFLSVINYCETTIQEFMNLKTFVFFFKAGRMNNEMFTRVYV